MRAAANYFDGVTSQITPIEIEVRENALVLFLFREKKEFKLSQIKINDNLGSAYLSIELPNGGRVECPGIKSREQLGLKSNNLLLRFLEKGALGILSSILLAVLGVWAGGAYLLPLAVDLITPNVPDAIFEQVDTLTLSSLDDKLLLPTTLPETKREEIEDYFNFLNKNTEEPRKTQIEFRATKDYLPNAFTLSGSTIIVTDDLVKMLDGKEEIGAILAHELGHQKLGHVKKRLVSLSSASLLVALVTGDFSNTIGLLSTTLWQIHLSREDEFQADEFGVKLVDKIGGDPMLLATGLQKLEAATEEKRLKKEPFEETFRLISTHPETVDRVERIKLLVRD